MYARVIQAIHPTHSLQVSQPCCEFIEDPESEIPLETFTSYLDIKGFGNNKEHEIMEPQEETWPPSWALSNDK